MHKFPLLVLPGFLLAGTAALGQTAMQRCSNEPVPFVKKQHIHHDGGKADINAIGMRRLEEGTNWYSLQKETEIGRKQAQQIERHMTVLEDSSVKSYIDRVGQNLVRHSDVATTVQIKVLDAPQSDVYGLPGGYLYVTSGLIESSDSEAELAAAMAHALAHIAGRHATRLMTRSDLAGTAGIPGFMTGIDCSSHYLCAGFIASPLAWAKFSRDFEAEADYLGIEYLYAAGYDPTAFLCWLEKLLPSEKNASSNARQFSWRPPISERLRAARKEIATILPVRNQSILTTPEFVAVKARLLACRANDPER